ncbi:MAG: carboxypeptidase-like regulatory domain-containing protein [Ignavibacteriales bacterium]|nr:carboxypeptidase-like regulatory domain-containing protein [Ignavibacteriales bacterium]
MRVELVAVGQACCSAWRVLSVAAAAYATEGRVIDERTGKPAAKVEVTILGRPGAVYTDADGRFCLEARPDAAVRGPGHPRRRAVHEAGPGREDARPTGCSRSGSPRSWTRPSR